ncbi:flagellar filament capping protein FliD [Colidextribacter sp. OB.20]|uniref:flagellar filament capping protein FliD n=1 Tax=Colidextribacter sp. OB.20 TaxID=2304568 RepID=UPI0013695883|nr:flagellar filament capping protein FliD [Colidextribacter sp. OB.20]
MASVGGVSSSNTVSSLMNSANMISGLASGLDTEGMIESLVKSYQTKISQLNQKVTKTEWKQDAYRSIIQKMVGFSNKYTSYTSNTNLMSPSFFSSAVKVLTKGEFADKVSASGKTSSDISLNAVHQLAKSAQYRTKSELATGESGVIRADKGVDLSVDAAKNMELSNLKGSLTLTYGSKTVSISFNESTDVDAMKDIRTKLAKDQGVDEKDVQDVDVLAELINQKLADEKIIFNNGNSEAASERIKATANPNGMIGFSELKGNNGLYISGASGNVAEQLGLSEEDLEDAKEKKITIIDTNNIKSASGGKGLTRELNTFEYLAEKGGAVMNMNLDGTTKQIAMPRVGYEKKEVEDEDGNKTTKEIYYINGKEVAKDELAAKYTEALQEGVKSAFGDKVTVENKATDGSLQLEFKVKNEGSDLVINTDVGDALGIGNTATSYLNTSKTLKDLMGDKLKDVKIATDENGHPLLDEKTGKVQYDFTINGVKIGTYTEDTKLSKIMSDINSNKSAGVQVGYSQTTQSFTFTSKETGADSKIEMGEGLAQAIFGSTDIPDRSGESFADAYGVEWLKMRPEGEKFKFSFSVPGREVQFNITKDTTVQEIVDELNDSPMGMNHSFAYNKYTGQIEAKDKKSGAALDFKITDHDGDSVEFDESNAPNIDYTAGQDAKFTITVNGEQKTMTRSSNSVNVDGLTINMEEEFDGSKNADGTQNLDSAGRPVYKNSVTFQSKTDSDKIIDAVKSMVEDYNTMMSEIKGAYSTMPYRKSGGSFANYEPLTDEEREGMSESAIERYEEKAKQGILFGDRNLNNLYTKMNQAFSFTSKEDIDTLKDMGISVSFDINTGAQTVQLDENKLRSMLDSDPDRVSELFTKEDGIMDRMKNQLDYYSKTTGEPKGVLIQQAGSPLSSLSLMNNQWQKEIDNYSNQIEKWQSKLESQVEKYTSQFARLEQLIQQMNSQSSTLAGMMGG